MNTATLSTKGQLVIPNRIRQALHLRAGDKVAFVLEGNRLVIEKAQSSQARLVKDRGGRKLLMAAKGAPEMTPQAVKLILADIP